MPTENEIAEELLASSQKIMNARKYTIGKRSIEREGLEATMREYRKMKRDATRTVDSGLFVQMVTPGDE